MKLSRRLELAADFCGGCRRLVEIGCDHAQLSAFVVKNGADSALACDLRKGPLSRAEKTAEKYGLKEKIELRLSDGLEKVCPSEGDTIALCGMGGELIAGILRSAPWALAGGHRLVMQPQSRSAFLRRFLAEKGVKITREGLVRDGGKLYCIIEGRGGAGRYQAENFGLFSDLLRNDRLFGDFIEEKAQKYRKIVEGRASGHLDTALDSQILKMLEGCKNAD